MEGTPRTHPDVKQLLGLISLLPPVDVEAPGGPPIDPVGFWVKYSDAHPQKYGGYIGMKLAAHLAAVQRGDAGWEAVRDLCGYCLMFFDVADEVQCVTLLDTVVGGRSSAVRPGSLGRRWADSVCQVAWRLFVAIQIELPRELR